MNDRVRMTKYTNIFSKGYTDNWWREIFIINSVMKTNNWAYKIKDLNGGEIKGSFYKRIVAEWTINELLSRIR